MAAYVDFTKAFDVVSSNKLVFKLHLFDISGNLLSCNLVLSCMTDGSVNL